MPVVGEHGLGTITRRSDGRLMVAVTMLDGRRIFRYVPKDRDPKRQARRAESLRKDLVAARERDIEPSTQTLADYLRSWIAALHDSRRRPRPRTLEHYRSIVEGKVIPALGNQRMDRLAPRHVQAWLDAEAGSPQSLAHYRAVLRRALNDAVRLEIIPRNPAINVALPDVPEFHGAPLTVAEARALLAVPDRLAPLWRLAIDTGLRESELLGLAWDNLDLDAGTMRLEAQLYRHDGEWERVAVKPGAKRERIHLMPSTVAALREHRARMAEERQPSWRYHGLVFVTTRGEPIGRSDALRAFKAACAAAGIPPRRLHDLRGSTATFLQDEGIPEPVRMARLGHATTKMARHYAEVRDQLDMDAASALEQLLG